MLAGLTKWRSCRPRGNLALEGASLWRFGIFRYIYDEIEALPRLSTSFYRVCCSDGCQMG